MVAMRRKVSRTLEATARVRKAAAEVRAEVAALRQEFGGLRQDVKELKTVVVIGLAELAATTRDIHALLHDRLVPIS